VFFNANIGTATATSSLGLLTVTTPAVETEQSCLRVK